MNTPSESLASLTASLSGRERARLRSRALSRWIRRSWAKCAAILLAVVWLTGLGLSSAIDHTALRRRFTAHLEAAFGRQVEVGSYRLSLWTGPVLEARSVRVSEDPRFGQEYFLYADSIFVRLRWAALLRGHVELGTLSLSRPSVNMVRNATGDWNVEEWLSRGKAGNGPVSNPALRFRRIDVSDGRIDFKSGDKKLPFAFAGVNGSVETDAPGRWRLTLDATPMRAALVLQQAGRIHLSGYVGGTSSRLRPGRLELSWTDASFPDFLRLATGDDGGVRGAMAVSVRAETDGDNWSLQGRAELRHLHRWDMAVRGDDPALTVIARTKWHPATSDLDALAAVVESPHSAADLTGVVDWGPPLGRGRTGSATSLQISSAAIDLRDVVSWIRAFHPGLPENLAVRGSIAARISLAGWPPRVQAASLSLAGATLTAKPLATPLRVSATTLRYGPSGSTFAPATVSFDEGKAEGSLRIEPATAARARAGGRPFAPESLISAAIFRALPGVRITGNVNQVRDLISAANALGWNLSRGWDMAGPVQCDLRWAPGVLPWESMPEGTIQVGAASRSSSEPGGASLWAPFLNLPIEHIRAAVALKPGNHQIALSSASAFGARWSGTFSRRGPESEWRFALSADHLSGNEIDRWLDPRWREGFLDRMLPFLKESHSAPAMPENLRASGTLNVNAVAIAPLEMRHLTGDLNIAGRRIALEHAEARFYGGQIGVVAQADLRAVPAYEGAFDFSGVDVSALAANVPGFTASVEGSASGRISFSAAGSNRDDLISSLACSGSARIEHPQWSGLHWPGKIAIAENRAGKQAFDQAQSSFTCGPNDIRLQDVVLTGGGLQVRGTGNIGFNRDLDLRLRVRDGSPGDARAGAASDAASNVYRLTGTTLAPRIARIAAPQESAAGER